MTAAAEDRVVIQSPRQSSRQEIKGMVVDYTGDQLSIRTGPMAVTKTFPTADVVSVETDYLPPHARGLELIAERKVREAEAQLTLALEDEERTWVRRELLATLVQCALAEDDLRKAALRFGPLVESDPHTRHWGLVPLVWDVDAVPVPSESEARTVIASGSRVAPLIAASWNLERNGRRSAEAEAELQKLATDADATLQRLAQMQLWRVRLATGTVTENEVRRWESAAEDLPRGLRAGAHVLVGRAAWQQQDTLRAAAEWMWLPLHHSEHFGLAAWGEMRAAEALQFAGDASGARRLAHEVSERYPGTLAVKRAQVLLQPPAESR